MAINMSSSPSQSSVAGGFFAISRKTISVATVPAISEVSRLTRPAKVGCDP